VYAAKILPRELLEIQVMFFTLILITGEVDADTFLTEGASFAPDFAP